MALRPLNSQITVNGLNQEDLVKLLLNIIDVVNELQDDHATYKTLVDELIADHATNIACIAANKTAINAIITAATSDSATNIAAVTAVSASPAATLTATAPASLTNSSNIVVTKG